LRIGLQLYSVRDEAEKDLPGVLEAVARMGYQGVEFAGYYGHNLADLRRQLEGLGLAAIGTHTRFADLAQDMARVVQEHHTLGAAYCTVPYYKAASADEWRQFARDLNTWGRQLQEAGLRLSYHNHHFEFEPTSASSVEPLEDTTPYTILRQVCDPTLVGLQLDVAWARKAGQDPAALIESLGAQSPIIHLKDVSPAGADMDIGEGLVDMRAVLETAGRSGVVWGIVERDSAPPPTLESARTNLKRLQALEVFP
jgi:sugar phosphate isomerase/epimerase